MASTWGNSWGDSWGHSWDIRSATAGGHFLPLTKKDRERLRKEAKTARHAQDAGWDAAAKDKAELHQQIMATLHPEKILGVGAVHAPEVLAVEDDEESDIEMLLLLG